MSSGMSWIGRQDVKEIEIKRTSESEWEKIIVIKTTVLRYDDGKIFIRHGEHMLWNEIYDERFVGKRSFREFNALTPHELNVMLGYEYGDE